MKIGVPKEIKPQEYRVGLVPSSVKELTLNGHKVFIETGAGEGIGIEDSLYEQEGAKILFSPEEIYAQSELIIKVKEPQPSEYPLIREGQILFTYLHLAPDPKQTQALVQSKCIGIAYETVTSNQGTLPLLAPMSEVAGRMSIQVGAYCLQKACGGSGVLLSGLPGVFPGNVVIIGGGVVGLNAALMAMGLGTRVIILDKNVERLRELDTYFGKRLTTIYSTHHTIEHYVSKADLVIGAVLVPGGSTPKLVNREMLSQMRPGSVLVDVAIDQGGCFETSRPTTHLDPIYTVDGVVHYCVANMPSGVSRTSAFALNNATLPYVLTLANKGFHQALMDDPHLMNGLNIYRGQVTQDLVARELGYNYVNPSQVVTGQY